MHDDELITSQPYQGRLSARFVALDLAELPLVTARLLVQDSEVKLGALSPTRELCENCR